MTATEPSSILMDARTIGPGMTGVGRYTYNLLWALSLVPGAPPLRVLMRRESLELARRDPVLGGMELIAAPYSHEQHPWADLWLERGLPRLLRPGELYHGPAFIAPGGRRPFPRVVTVHDLFVFTHPRYYPLRFRTWLRWAMRRACRGADRVLVPSEATADELERFGLARREKIRLTPYAPDDTPSLWDRGALGAGGMLAGLVQEGREYPLIVTVGSLEPRKDPATARHAHLGLVERLDRQPVAAGRQGPVPGLGRRADWLWLGGPGSLPDDSPVSLRRLAAVCGFHEVGHVPKEGVREALRAATIYVSCSRSEGFGMPLVEAMVAGCPIVASDIPVHHEVAGDAALYFPPGDAGALADILHRLLAKPALREGLAQRGLERQESFRWSRTAELTLAAYRDI